MTQPFPRAWNRYNCVGRLFMTAIYVISFCGMGAFSYYTFQRYNSEPVSMTLNTEYSNYSFPAISICLMKGKGVKPMMPIIEKLNITVKGSKSNFLRFLQDCMFANTLHSNPTLLDGCDDLQSSHGVNVKQINDMFLPRNCHDFLDKVYYNKELISNCSEFFKHHKTELGDCFTVNSIIDNGYSFNNLKLGYDFFSKTKILSMRLRISRLWQYMLHVHSPGDVPFLFSIATEVSNSKLLSYNVDEIITDADASKKSIQQRRCRFPHEKLDGMPFHYSFSTCMSFLRIKLEIKECNCTHTVSPDQYQSYYCNFTGKMCLHNKGINKKIAYQARMDETCVPGCREQILKYSGQSDFGLIKSETHTYIAFEVVNTPTSRYMRSVTHTILDLAVSIAGLAGLFFGASVLNFIEIIYHMFAVKK